MEKYRIPKKDLRDNINRRREVPPATSRSSTPSSSGRDKSPEHHRDQRRHRDESPDRRSERDLSRDSARSKMGSSRTHSRGRSQGRHDSLSHSSQAGSSSDLRRGRDEQKSGFGNKRPRSPTGSRSSSSVRPPPEKKGKPNPKTVGFRELPFISKEMKDTILENLQDKDVSRFTSGNPTPLKTEVVQSIAQEALNYGFVGFTFNSKRVILGSPMGAVLVLFRKRETELFRIPESIRDVLRDRHIIKMIIDADLDDVGPIEKEIGTEINSVYVYEYTLKESYNDLYDLEMPSDVGRFSNPDLLNEFDKIHLSRQGKSVTWTIWNETFDNEVLKSINDEVNIMPWVREEGLKYSGFKSNQINNASELAKKLFEDPYFIDIKQVGFNDLTNLETFKTEADLIRKDEIDLTDFEAANVQSMSDFCATCGHRGHRSKDCGKPSGCIYPLCKKAETHTILTCRAFTNVCKTCKRRGHYEEAHEEAYEGAHSSQTTFDHLFLLYSPANIKAGALWTETNPQPGHWRASLFNAGPYEVPKFAVSSGRPMPKPVEPTFKVPVPKTGNTKPLSGNVRIELAEVNRQICFLEKKLEANQIYKDLMRLKARQAEILDFMGAPTGPPNSRPGFVQTVEQTIDNTDHQTSAVEVYRFDPNLVRTTTLIDLPKTISKPGPAPREKEGELQDPIIPVSMDTNEVIPEEMNLELTTITTTSTVTDDSVIPTSETGGPESTDEQMDTDMRDTDDFINELAASAKIDLSDAANLHGSNNSDSDE